MRSEREQFSSYRDKDHDGKLNRQEVANWIMPEDFDHAEAEAKHLIYEADTNKVLSDKRVVLCVAHKFLV